MIEECYKWKWESKWKWEWEWKWKIRIKLWINKKNVYIIIITGLIDKKSCKKEKKILEKKSCSVL